MPTGKKSPPGPLSRAVADVLRERLDELSKDGRGISQAEIGRTNRDEPGYVSQSQLSRFFNHTKEIDVDQLGALCEILEIGVVKVVEDAERRATRSNVVTLRPRKRVSGTAENDKATAKKKSRDRGEQPGDT